jgi:UPF0042 nucleotide-binding protein
MSGGGGHTSEIPTSSGRVVVVTGMSGAGKSTALDALEDLGFFCIDNLPPAVIAHAVEACEEEDVVDVALGLHVRVRSFLEDAAEVIGRMSRAQRKPPAPPPSRTGQDVPEPTPLPAPVSDPGARRLVVLFLEASDEALVRRFSETRRPHPLAPGHEGRSLSSLGNPEESVPGSLIAPSQEVGPVIDGIRTERERLAPLRELASIVLDTSHLTVHQLRKQVMGILGPEHRPHMETRVVSFGFKYGLPSDANVVLDVRFLDNPYFVPELKPMTGLDAPVRDFVMKAPEAVEFLERAEAMLSFALPRYEREGKSYLTVAIGCTGGQHRSVALAEALATRLRTATRMKVTAGHRDVARNSSAGSGRT